MNFNAAVEQRADGVNLLARTAARPLEIGLNCVAALSALLFLATSLFYLAYGHWSMTHLDFWRVYDICLNHSWFESAWPKFNNHSLFFPSFIWLSDLRFFHGNQELVFWAGMFLLTATVALILIPLFRDTKLSVTGKISALIVVIVADYWMGRASITASGGFNSIASFSMLGNVLAFVSLPLMRPHSRQWRLGMTLVLLGGFIASFSYSSGLATWPTLLLLGWALRLHWSPLLVIALAGLAAITTFTLLPDPSRTSADLQASLSLAPSFASSALLRLCRLVGSPVLSAAMAWKSAKELPQGVEFSLLSLSSGVLGLMLAACLFLPRLLRRDLGENKLEFIGLALLISNLLILVIIVIGRTSNMKLIPGEVAAPRYFFWSTLFWAGLLLTVICYAESAQWTRLLLLLVAMFGLIFVFPRHYLEGARYRYVALLARYGSTSLINGVHDDQAVKILFADPRQIYRVAAELREARLDIFASGEQNWLGQNQKEIFDSKHHSTGMKVSCRVDYVVHSKDDPPAARVIGSATQRGGGAPQKLVILDDKDIICGVGQTFSTDRTLSRLLYGGNFSGRSFTAYIPHYNAATHYRIRSADHGQISDEVARIPGPTQLLNSASE